VKYGQTLEHIHTGERFTYEGEGTDGWGVFHKLNNGKSVLEVSDHLLRTQYVAVEGER
jgi:hypothetical protein